LPEPYKRLSRPVLAIPILKMLVYRNMYVVERILKPIKSTYSTQTPGLN